MIGQIDSEADSQVQNQQQLPTPRFQARMSLVEARAIILAALSSLSECGYTRRVGMLAREVCGVRFGEYRPHEVMDWLRSSDFEGKFQEALEIWKKGWGTAPSVKAARMREKQYRACKQSIDERWWERVADAIESMLAARAQQVVLEDVAGNRRVQSLVDVLDLMFWIRMTPARAAAMKVVGMGE